MPELSRVYASSDGVVNQVSVLVSVADAYATKPLLHTQLELKAAVGIDRLWWRMTLILCLFLQVIQADCVTIEVPGFHLVY